MFVFDLNGTLLKRISKPSQDIKKLAAKNIYPVGETKIHFIFFRPHLNDLADFLHTNKIPYIFWSTATYENTEILVKLLKPIFLNVKGFLSYQECEVGKEKGDIKAEKWVKNLEKTRKLFGVSDFNNLYLIDDSVEKVYNDQNYIPIKRFNGENDDEILFLIENLKGVINNL